MNGCLKLALWGVDASHLLSTGCTRDFIPLNNVLELYYISRYLEFHVTCLRIADGIYFVHFSKCHWLVVETFVPSTPYQLLDKLTRDRIVRFTYCVTVVLLLWLHKK